MNLPEKPTTSAEEMDHALRLVDEYIRKIPGICELVPGSGTTAIARREPYLMFICRLRGYEGESDEWWVVDFASNEVHEVPTHQHPMEFFEELVSSAS